MASSQTSSSDLARSRLWSSFKLAYFVPLSDIEYFTKIGRLLQVLDRAYPRRYGQQILERTLAPVRRLYRTLLYIGRIDLLQSFLANGFSDSKLPLVDPAGFPNLQVATGCDRDVIDQFLEAQWMFLALYFEADSSTLVVVPKMPLPFIYKASETKVARNSVIDQVHIHEAYHNVFKPHGVSCPLMALKSFQSSKRQRFRKELETLKILNQGHSRYIIKLLASFSCSDYHGLLFPWAEMNLHEVFADNISSSEESFAETWILRQMTGLAQGLSVIHQRPDLHDGNILYGRHGDLHPLNILLVKTLDDPSINEKGVLQLSSMGQVEFFRSPEEFSIPKNAGMYEAPECQLEHAAGPSYDMWSLGCIFLEMLVWLSSGSQGLHQFSRARLNPDPIYGERVQDDYFFTLLAKEGKYVGAELRPSVKSWIRRCQGHWETGSVFRKVLCIIEGHMLQPCPFRRLPSGVIYSKFQSLCIILES